MDKKDRINVEPLAGRKGALKYTNPDWGTIAYFIPKTDFVTNPTFKEVELSYNCIYFLVGYENTSSLGSIEKMYVGQAGIRNDGGSVLKRTSEHLKNVYESYYDKWDYIAVLTNEKGDWGSTEIDALEYIFWSLIPVGNRYNGKLPSSKGADLSIYADITNQIKAYLTKMQFSMFSKDTEEKTEEQVQKIAAAKSDTPLDLNDGTITIPDITTPKRIVNKMIDMLPQQLFDNPDITFFDPACKGGEYLEAIFDRCMSSKIHRSHFESKARPEMAQAMHIISKQLYGVALTPNSYRIAYDKLYESQNIWLISDYVRKLKIKGIHKLLIEELGIDMKIDVVIGNPPYQDESGRASIYKDFVEESADIADVVVMITRDNWLNGKAFKSMRDKLTVNGTIKDIVHYPKIGEVFPGIKVSAAYFSWFRGEKKNTNYTCIKDGNIVLTQELDLTNGIIYKSEIAKSILTKVGNRSKWAQTFNTRSYPFMDQRKRYGMYSVDVKDEEHTIGVMINGERPAYVSIGNFSNIDEVYKYKVMCGVIVNEASIENPGNVLTNIKAIGKGVVASETWSLVASFDTEEETVNCKKYIMTKFVRFIANQSVNGRSNVTDNTFECVPLQDFTEGSDIDWTQSIEDIDAQLYRKYNLSSEEISYIERTVKQMVINEVANQKAKFTRQEIEAAMVNKIIQNN